MAKKAASGWAEPTGGQDTRVGVSHSQGPQTVFREAVPTLVCKSY